MQPGIWACHSTPVFQVRPVAELKQSPTTKCTSRRLRRNGIPYVECSSDLALGRQPARHSQSYLESVVSRGERFFHSVRPAMTSNHRANSRVNVWAGMRWANNAARGAATTPVAARRSVGRHTT